MDHIYIFLHHELIHDYDHVCKLQEMLMQEPDEMCQYFQKHPERYNSWTLHTLCKSNPYCSEHFFAPRSSVRRGRAALRTYTLVRDGLGAQWDDGSGCQHDQEQDAAEVQEVDVEHGTFYPLRSGVLYIWNR